MVSFGIKNKKRLEKIKHVTIVYDNSDKTMDYFLKGLKIVDDSDGQNYLYDIRKYDVLLLQLLNFFFLFTRVELDQSLKSSKERVAKAKATVKTETGKINLKEI